MTTGILLSRTSSRWTLSRPFQRGGRVVPTLYIEPESPTNAVAAESSVPRAGYHQDDRSGCQDRRIKGQRYLYHTSAAQDRYAQAKHALTDDDDALAALGEGNDPYLRRWTSLCRVLWAWDGFTKLAKNEIQRDSSSHYRLPPSPAGLGIGLLAAEAMTKAVPSTRWAVGMLMAKVDVYLFDLLKPIFAGENLCRFAFRQERMSRLN